MYAEHDDEDNPRRVAYTDIGTHTVSTVLTSDGACFETKVFGPGADGLPHDYEIRVMFRDQAMVNHCNAVDALRTGKKLRPPENSC
jgi:hypothetical protein